MPSSTSVHGHGLLVEGAFGSGWFTFLVAVGFSRGANKPSHPDMLAATSRHLQIRGNEYTEASLHP